MTTASLGTVTHPVCVTFGDAFLRPGLATHRLTIDMTVIGTWLDAQNPEANASLLVQGYLWVGPQMKPVTQIGARVLTVRGYQVSESLDLTLTDDQLIALEPERQDNGVELVIDLQTTLLGAPPGVYPTGNSQTSYRIPRHRWLELLDQVGAAVGITVRVPSPLTDAATRDADAAPEAPSMVRATKRLREARTALRDNDVEGCIKSCRAVLENIKQLAAPLPAEPVRKKGPQTRTQEERWSSLFYDLYSLASAASHDDDLTATFIWTRVDAQAILAATAGLLARLPT